MSQWKKNLFNLRPPAERRRRQIIPQVAVDQAKEFLKVQGVTSVTLEGGKEIPVEELNPSQLVFVAHQVARHQRNKEQVTEAPIAEPHREDKIT